jgi:hypothetical protein
MVNKRRRKRTESGEDWATRAALEPASAPSTSRRAAAFHIAMNPRPVEKERESERGKLEADPGGE